MINQERLIVPFYSSGMHVIYGIKNNVTNKYYVGQTIKVFTSRWFQHFFESPIKGRYGAKFGEAIRNSKLTDWSFCVLEEIVYPSTIIQSETLMRKYRSCRECYWMDKFNSIKDGYNVSYSTSDYYKGMYDIDPEYEEIVAKYRMRKKLREEQWAREDVEEYQKNKLKISNGTN